MTSKPRPNTEFPSPETSASLAVRLENVKGSRYTKFPGGLGLQKLSITETTGQSTSGSKSGAIAQTISPIPIKINPPNAVPTRAIPKENIELGRGEQLCTLEIRDPWETYTALRPLQRGSEVTVACTRIAPIKLVVIQKISSD